MSKKTRIIEIGGAPHIVRSTGRYRMGIFTLNGYAVRPESGGVEWTTLMPPGRDVAEHVRWIAAGEPCAFKEWSNYGGSR